MTVFDEKISVQLREVLSGMINKVHLVYYSQEFECPSCAMTRSFVEEMASFSDKIDLSIKELVKDKEKAALYQVNKVPSIVLLDSDGKDTGIRFYGLPGGYEINSFISALLEASGKREALPGEVVSRIASIDKDIHIQVFVSLGCPYCPSAVTTAHRLALENSNIRADMVDTAVFPHLGIKYNVSSVPRIVINETHGFVGTQGLEEFLNEIEKV